MTTQALASGATTTARIRRDSGVARGLGVNAGLALVGDAASKIGLLFVLAIAGQVLSEAQFAIFGVCLAAVSVVTALLDLGVGVTITRDGTRSATVRRSLLVSSLQARVPFAVAVTIGSLLVGAILGAPLEWFVVALAGIAGATTITLLALFRAAQVLEVEAGQRVVAALLGIVAVVAALWIWPTAAAALLALTVSAVVALPMIVGPLRRVIGQEATQPMAHVLRVSLPFGAMGIATIAYFRAPTLVLGALGTSAQTAAFTVAATIGFGLLAVPNAITTGLLPRLASITSDEERNEVARRALRWTLVSTIGIGAAVLAVAPWVIELAFGAKYRDAAGPLALLLAAGVVIGLNGLVGTVLIAARKIRVLAVQVAASLLVNVVAAAMLIPRHGAWGAAAATLLAEVVALAILAPAVTQVVPGLLRPHSWRGPVALVAATSLAAAAASSDGAPRLAFGFVAVTAVVISDPRLAHGVATFSVRWVRRIGALRSAVISMLAGLGALATYAANSNYGLRVTSDSPSFLAIVHQLAVRPFKPLSPFLVSDSIEHSHATPYMQLLASIWDRTLARHGADGVPIASPTSVHRVLALAGLVVTAMFLHALFRWVRSHSTSRAAWFSIPVVLILLGPAHVIWAGDLSFHAALYGSYFPQTLAMALLLYALVIVGGPHLAWRYPAGALAVGATLVVHPFTGALLCALLTVGASVRALRHQPRWGVAGWSMLGGFGLTFAWPGYSVDLALAETGMRGRAFITVCVLLPIVAHAAPRALARLGGRTRRALVRADRPATGRLLAVLGVSIMLAVTVVQVLALRTNAEFEPIRHNRLALYWGDDRWRWPFMLALGAVGLIGLVRVAGRGRTIPLVWFAGAMAIGCIGAAGLAVPVWWRFILFCQVPLALGTAVWLAESELRWPQRLVIGGLGFSLAYRLITLMVLPASFSYLGTPIQTAYGLGEIVPRGEGLVASDPFTSYFVPGATGHKVLVVTKGHVNSRAELEASNRGYHLLHEFAAGKKWWYAARGMYKAGVRYIVIEKHTLLRAKTLEEFSYGPTPVATDADQPFMSTYFYRNGRVGKLVHTDDTYAVYKLQARKLGLA